MAIYPPTAGTIDAENHRDAFVSGPTEQSELEMLREFEATIRKAKKDGMRFPVQWFFAMASDALRNLDRKRGR